MSEKHKEKEIKSIISKLVKYFKVSQMMSFVTALTMLIGYVPMVNRGEVHAEGESSPKGYLSEIKDELGVDNIPDDWYIKPDDNFYNTISQNYDDGYNTEDTALEISSAGELAAFAKFVNDGGRGWGNHSFIRKFVKLTQNIDLGGSGISFTKSELTKDEHGNNCFTLTVGKNGTPKNLWTPIGSNNIFCGTFDGQDHEISGMLAFSKYATGLFGVANSQGNGKIQNLGVSGDAFAHPPSSSYYISAGGLIGMNYHCEISNCYATGNSYAYYPSGTAYTGGLVGYNEFNTTITNCYATGDTYAYSSEGWAFSGGLVGNNIGYITNCYATGNAYTCSSSSNSYAGGLIGMDDGDAMSHCYATGNVYAYSSSGNTSAGGFMGHSYTISMNNCYATGDAYAFSSSANSYASGLIGNNSFFEISNCYATGNSYAISSKKDTFAGGLIGHNDRGGTLTNCYVTGDVYAYSSFGNAFSGGLMDNNKAVLWYGEEYDKDMVITNCYRYSGANVMALVLNGKICNEGTPIDDINNFKGNVITNLGNFTDFNKDDAWIFTDGEYPKLKAFVKSDSTKYKDDATKVQLEWAEGVFPKNVHIEISEVSEEENYNTVLSKLDEKQKNIMEKIKFYDIKVINQDTGETCQPNGKVTIRLPIPDNFDKDELEALRVADGKDVEFKDEKVVLIDGQTKYLEFETDHFSYYALMDLLSKDDVNYNIRLFMILFATLILGIAIIFVIRFNVHKKREANN